jgi:hypothetical protein
MVSDPKVGGGVMVSDADPDTDPNSLKKNKFLVDKQKKGDILQTSVLRFWVLADRIILLTERLDALTGVIASFLKQEVLFSPRKRCAVIPMFRKIRVLRVVLYARYNIF